MMPNNKPITTTITVMIFKPAMIRTVFRMILATLIGPKTTGESFDSL
jgi:hypothetical protein